MITGDGYAMLGDISLAALQAETLSAMSMRTCGIIVRNEWTKVMSIQIYNNIHL